MPVTINGTTGIAGIDGSASTPAVQGTDTNTGIFFPAADTIAFGEGGTESMRIDSSGNVGIGTTSPAKKLEVASGTGAYTDIAVFRTAETTSTSNVGGGFSGTPSATAGTRQAYMWLDADGANFTGSDYFFIAKVGNSGDVQLNQVSNANMLFYTNNAERARITSGGYFKASNNGSYVSSTGTYHELCQSDDTASTIIRATNSTYSYTGGATRISIARNTTNGSFNALVYYNEGAAANKFVIADSGNATNTNGSYGTISDIKIKQDITDATPQWDDIKNLRFRKYRLKNEVALDPNAKPFLGLIAQEAELVCPGLIEESRDTEEVETTDADGNVVRERRDLGTTTKSIKTSILYMKAVKALQEAQLRIETLEAQNAAFEARLAALEAK